MAQIGLSFHTYHSNSAGETIIKIENADNNSLCTVGYPVGLQKTKQCLKKYKTYQLVRSFSLLSLLYLVYLVYYYACASDVSCNNIISYRKKKDRRFPISFT